jgi:hypothetical protein
MDTNPSHRNAPYFNAQVLPTPTNEYVAWIDVMGVQSAMSRSLDITANFVFKLHVAALQAPHAGVSLYPVMDGLYISSPSQQAVLDFLRSMFSNIAEVFVAETENLHRFIVPGAVAFGPVIHGAAVPATASHHRADSILYDRKRIDAHADLARQYFAS